MKTITLLDKDVGSLVDTSVKLRFEFQLLRKTDGFIIYNALKGIHDCTEHRDRQRMRK